MVVSPGVILFSRTWPGD